MRTLVAMFRQHRPWPLALVLVLGAGACDVFGAAADGAPTDGDVCHADDECSSGVCTTANLCSHSLCKCPNGACAEHGSVVDDCRDDWVCVDRESIFDPVVEFFDGTPAKDQGYCQRPCAADCPDHYTCQPTDGFCRPDTEWTRPEPTIRWRGVVSGEVTGNMNSATVTVERGATLMLEGSASSPVDAAITGFTWTTVSDAGDYVSSEGERIELQVPEQGGYRRAELSVSDDRLRGAIVTVVFESCAPAGAACGYMGSGCCTSCDADGVSCL